MVEVLCRFIVTFAYVILGARFIYCAVDEFKKEKYFMFGSSIMIVILEAALIFKVVLES